MSERFQAYCVKCKTKQEITNPKSVYTKTGTPAVEGLCSVCGTKLFRMGRTEAHANIAKPQATAKPKRQPKTTSAKTKKKQTAANHSRRKHIGKLVIVESPAKARSVGGFLGNKYTVMASKGHVRDLLVTQLSVDVENDFEPTYRVPNDKRDTVKQLKEAVDAADEIYLATDPDREGEAIAWHLIAATDLKETDVKRVVFHEITRPAIEHAFNHPRAINDDLVNAQQARRILDRLVGYNITQLLWDRVRNRLSAGRVQSIALRLVVDREREIEAFVPEEYWTIDAKLQKRHANGKDNMPFLARLVKINDDDVKLGSKAQVQPHLDVLEMSRYIVSEVKKGTRQRKPSAPFTTSTLQQEASRRLGYNARRTMQLAQQLYEGIEMTGGDVAGLITYMRTDSVQVSEQAQKEARAYIREKYGKDYVPSHAPQYKTKTKGAQEAHEAIRPTDVNRTPDRVKSYLKGDQFRLYKLIWERFVASQMANAIYDTVRIDIKAGLAAHDMPYLFRSTGSTLKFKGFLALYEDVRDEDLNDESDEGRIFPELSVDELLNLIELRPEQHFTQPPPRYTEATLVRALEENGIGRPSTYAPTVSVIQDRDYVTKEDNRLVPTETGKIVNDLLVEYFPEELDYQFTARMEDELDEIAEGELEWRPMLREFYESFEKRLEHARNNMPRIQQEEKVGRNCPESGHPLVIRYGRWGKFIGCSNYPECRYTEPYVEYAGVACPKCGEEHGGQLVVLRTKKGSTFYGCSRFPECDYKTWKLPRRGKQPEDEAMPDIFTG